MTSKELNLLLIEAFPNLKNNYDEEVNWQEGDDTGSHTVYGDVLTPYVKQCFEKDEREEINYTFAFLEALLKKEDSYIDEVVTFSVLESLDEISIEDPAFFHSLGEKTKDVLNELH